MEKTIFGETGTAARKILKAKSKGLVYEFAGKQVN